MMDRNPKVTVLMPVYNGQRYLRKAVESILNQTFTDFEFLIINDGSTDESENIIRSYRDPRIRLVTNERNLKLIASLNKGINLARGQYIARMDCDDISAPQRLEQQVLFMDSHKEVGVCGSWIEVFGDGCRNVQKYPATSHEIKALMFFYSSLAHPSVIIRRDVLVKNGLTYDPAFVNAEDYHLWTTAGRYTDFANIQEVLLHYRLTPTQLSSMNKKEQLDITFKVMGIQLHNLGICPTDQERSIHKYMIMNQLVSDHPGLMDIRLWLNKLLDANKRTKIYSEPFFGDLLKRKWFLVVINYLKEHRDKIKINSCGLQGFFWLLRSLITRRKITNYM